MLPLALSLVLSAPLLALSAPLLAALSVFSPDFLAVCSALSADLFTSSPADLAAFSVDSPALLAASDASSARAVLAQPRPSDSAPARPKPISCFFMRHLQPTAVAVPASILDTERPPASPSARRAACFAPPAEDLDGWARRS